MRNISKVSLKFTASISRTFFMVMALFIGMLETAIYPPQSLTLGNIAFWERKNRSRLIDMFPKSSSLEQYFQYSYG
jgi:hypothetical protein